MAKNPDAEYLRKLRKVQLEILDYVFDFCAQHHLQIMLYGGTALGAIRHKGYIPWDDDIDLGMPRADYDKFIKLWHDTDKLMLDYYHTNPDYWLPFLKIRNKHTEFIESGIQEDYPGPTGIWVDIMPFDNADALDSDTIRKRHHMFRYYGEMIMRKSAINISLNDGLKNKVKSVITGFVPRDRAIAKQYAAATANRDDKSKYIICYHYRNANKPRTWERAKIFPLKKVEFEGKKYCMPHDADYYLARIYGSDYMKLPPLDQRKTHHPARVRFEDGSEIKFA